MRPRRCREYSNAFAAAEAEAQRARAGIWAGTLEKPADYRKRVKAGGDERGAQLLGSSSTMSSSTPPAGADRGAAAAAPKPQPASATCEGSTAIKGNVNSKGERIFHVPGARACGRGVLVWQGT